MPTFLTTKKMSPELKARVQASVRGDRAVAQRKLTPRAVSHLRWLVALSVTLAVVFLWRVRRQAQAEIEGARSSLLQLHDREASTLTDSDREIVGRVQHWLAAMAKGRPEDHIATQVSLKGLASILARSSVYVRVPLEATSALKTFEKSALSSTKDAFVLCLARPPEERSEPKLRRAVQLAYRGDDKLREATANVQPLRDAMVGLPFLEPPFRARVLEATRRELEGLRKSFDQAPVAEAKRAAKADQLLVALDESPDTNEPAELDGERAHYVRVGLVDLVAEKLLLRLRRRVDPTWLSDRTRADYARGVDSCALAFDVHAAVAASRTSAANTSN